MKGRKREGKEGRNEGGREERREGTNGDPVQVRAAPVRSRQGRVHRQEKQQPFLSSSAEHCLPLLGKDTKALGGYGTLPCREVNLTHLTHRPSSREFYYVPSKLFT